MEMNAMAFMYVFMKFLTTFHMFMESLKAIRLHMRALCL